MMRGRFGQILVYSVLALSLLANAVVIGLWMRFREASGGEPLWRRLPAEARIAFRENLNDVQSPLRLQIRALAKARATLFDIAAARPYDRPRVEAALADVAEATRILQATAQGILLQGFDAAAGLDP